MSAADIAIVAFILGLIFGAWGFFRCLKYGVTNQPAVRDTFVRAAFTLATAEEVQRWRRGEFQAE